ncbi:hypothetical protein H6F51_12635 [Cyanobacteria bacterium FACHB-DQ100]|uniref:hypothetical protein n=1 Tax=unclassified Leptolyngbya TaxID=2650499 RepID=UPI001680A00B|nr:hypothetical protein [Leptolyngbya sp. FACHB-17]MBD1823327.1 hypothetical protein [Cyanobacteria bacterium FACHB-DQ100]MBD2083217.1 hypothetical protein [Leptolyngbya sp. FACHB-17]
MQKLSKSSLLFFYGVLGMGYFNAFSSLDINPILRNYLILVPVQIGLVVYFLWFRRDTLKD